MPPYLEIENMRDGYLHVVNYVYLKGEESAPRGMRTREVLGATIRLSDPTDALPVGVNRGVNLRLAAAEAAQLIGGFSDPPLLTRVAPNTRQFMDHGAYHGAYGPRVRAQLPAVVARLRKDPHTRQAVALVWDPLRDLFVEDIKDYPCTVGFQFMIRDGKLIMQTHMRSNDVWWGTAYDVFQFTQLQLTLATVLGVEAGDYYHHAGSLHAYERDFADIERLDPFAESTAVPPRVTGFGRLGDSIHEAMARARSVAQDGAPWDATPSERWYAEKLA